MIPIRQPPLILQSGLPHQSCGLQIFCPLHHGPKYLPHKRSKDISLSKLEILADFYCMPLDYFRTNSSFKANNVSGNNYYVGNVSVSTNLLLENENLRKQIESLEREKESLNATIASKEDTNTVLKDHVESLKKQLEFYQKV